MSGILLVALERARLLMPILHRFTKTYVTVMKLHGDVSNEKIREVINEFTGEITQVPPVRSSVKRRPRKRKIYSIEILDQNGQFILLKVKCEAGTYIRKLIHDIGVALGVGAHMADLRRIAFGGLSENESHVTLQELHHAYMSWKKERGEKEIRKAILPVEVTLEGTPKIIVKSSSVGSICNGAKLASTGVLRLSKNIKKGEKIVLMTNKGEIVAIAQALKDSEEIMKMEKGFIAQPIRVIMEKGTYPPVWRKKR